MRFVAGVTCVLAVVATARAASDGDFALEYEAPDGAGCPTATELRAAVAGELGYDPWDPVDDRTSPRIVVLIRTAREGGVRGRVEMRAADGRRLGAREWTAGGCGELSQTLELAIAMAIDPLRAAVLPAPASKPEPAPAKAEPVTTPAVDAEVPPRAPSTIERAPPSRLVDELRVRMAFGVQGSVAAAPGPTIGFMGRIGLVLRRWSLAVELHGDLPGAATVDGGHLSASTLAAFGVACAAHRVVAFCLLGGGGGQELAASGFAQAQSSWVPYAAVGARIEAGLPITGALAVLVRVDLLVPLTRAALYVGTGPPLRVYRSAPLSNRFGLALSTR